MTLASISCIVPRLHPAIDGVGDYALNLACQLRESFGIETNFIVGDRTWIGSSTIEGFPVSQMEKYTVEELLSLLPSCPILLHYVGYGYAKRGCPLWLAEGLQRWRVANEKHFLVTMFHEIYATGKPWTSAFWLSPVQKNIAARLAQVSDRCLTSRQDYAQILHNFHRGKHQEIPTLPVISNIGEPKQVSPLAQRERRLVVFGRTNKRLRVYRDSLAKLELTCQQLRIKEILDIGTPIDVPLPTVKNVPIVEMGQQSATDISNILLNSWVGFLDYHPDYLAKSTIFAAYCAHGLLPVILNSSTFSKDDITAGKHYWIPDEDSQEIQAIADNAYQWYQTHRLSEQAQTFAAQFLF